jgi:hypothetical protein
MIDLKLPRFAWSNQSIRIAWIWLSLIPVALTWIVTEKMYFDRFWWSVILVAALGGIANLTTYGQIYNLVIVILLCLVGAYFIYL